MRALILTLAITLLVSVSGRAQEKPSQQGQETERPQADQPQPQAQQPQEQQRPTLGAAPAPSLHGPRTSTTTDRRRLARVRKIYIERIDNALHEKLIELIGKSHLFRIVGDRKDAEAVLRGTCFDSRRLKTLRTEVYLNDVNGEAIWLDSVRRPINPPKIEVAVNEAATLIFNHLNESVMEAERH
jgi:hypothetical protein